MRIIYAENPLKTTFELTEEEKVLFKARVLIQELTDSIGTAEFFLDDKYLDINRAKNTLEDSEDEERLLHIYEYYLSNLSHTHIGDCTCFAASCVKCAAEHILGFDSIKHLGKHEGSKLFHAFDKYKNITDVLAYLDNYIPQMTETWMGSEEAFKSHLPRWRQEAKSAYNWLKNYKETKAFTVEEIPLHTLEFKWL